MLARVHALVLVLMLVISPVTMSACVGAQNAGFVRAVGVLWSGHEHVGLSSFDFQGLKFLRRLLSLQALIQMLLRAFRTEKDLVTPDTSARAPPCPRSTRSSPDAGRLAR